jgi:hypothetical protein
MLLFFALEILGLEASLFLDFHWVDALAWSGFVLRVKIAVSRTRVGEAQDDGCWIGQ